LGSISCSWVGISIVCDVHKSLESAEIEHIRRERQIPIDQGFILQETPWLENRSMELNADVCPHDSSPFAVIEVLIPSLPIAFGVVDGIEFLQHSWWLANSPATVVVPSLSLRWPILATIYTSSCSNNLRGQAGLRSVMFV
jgi:hypothetical protein